MCAVWTDRIQSVMRCHGARGSIAANNELMDVEDRFDVLVDANDQLLERVVSFVFDCLCLFVKIQPWLIGPGDRTFTCTTQSMLVVMDFTWLTQQMAKVLYFYLNDPSGCQGHRLFPGWPIKVIYLDDPKQPSSVNSLWTLFIIFLSFLRRFLSRFFGLTDRFTVMTRWCNSSVLNIVQWW